jgi:hypothetical protein
MRPTVPNLHKRYPVPAARVVPYVILGLWLYENRLLCRGAD